MIELMVTVAIISILAAIALPSFSSTIERQRLRLVIETVVSDFRQARSTAEAQGARGSSTIEFSVNGGDATIWSYTVSNAMSGTLVSEGAPGDEGTFPAVDISTAGCALVSYALEHSCSTGDNANFSVCRDTDGSLLSGTSTWVIVYLQTTKRVVEAYLLAHPSQYRWSCNWNGQLSASGGICLATNSRLSDL